VILGGTLSGLDADEAREVVAGYAGRLAPGSAVVISCFSYADQGLAARMAWAFGGTGRFVNHGREDVASFFEAAGLRLVRSEVDDVSCWPLEPSCAQKAAAVIGGIGIRGQS
jgi:hypothetical protein